MVDNQSSAVRCHVVAVTPDLTQVFVLRTAAGWLLPCVESSVLQGVIPSVQSMLARLTSVSTIVHADLISWGRHLPSDAYCIALVLGTPRSDTAQLVRLSMLESMPSLLPVQRQALSASLGRQREPRAPFDGAAAVSAALRWSERQMAERAGAKLLSTSWHRSSRHECVMRLETSVGPMYLKGGRARVADEATLTDLLRRRRPWQFPVTLAIDRAHDRWLYQELEGEQLFGPLLTTEMAAAAARALASLQREVIHDADVRNHLHGRQMNAARLFRSADEIVRRAWGSSTEAGERPTGYGRWCGAYDRMLGRCVELDDKGSPMSLVLSDFWTKNVLHTPHGFGFIDVGQSYWSYPVLSLWRFVNDVENQLKLQGTSRVQIEQAFADEWAGEIAPEGTRAWLDHLPFLGQLFNMLLIANKWDVEERVLGAVLPPVYRATQLSPHVRSIVRAFWHLLR